MDFEGLEETHSGSELLLVQTHEAERRGNPRGGEGARC